MTKLTDLPQEIRRLSANAEVRRIPLPSQGEMVWRLWGKGPPIVLLHGGAGSWLHWAKTIDDLVANSWRVVVPDLQGFGDSSELSGEYTMEDIRKSLVLGLVAVAPSPSYRLVGFSFGGVVAGHVAEELGDRAAHLVICGSGGMGARRPPMQPLVMWRNLPEEQQRIAHRRNLEILMFHDPARITDADVSIQAYNAERARGASRSFSQTDTLFRSLMRRRPFLDGIWGSHDATSKGFLDERVALLRMIDPSSDFIQLPEAGHWVQREAPCAFREALFFILKKRLSNKPRILLYYTNSMRFRS